VANPLDPQLGPLQNNGGPAIGAPGHTMTLQTQAPQPGSPAIGNGVLFGAPLTDARGFPSGVLTGSVNAGAVSQTPAPVMTASSSNPYQTYLANFVSRLNGLT
jgi:hypothetical protein